MSDEVLGVGSVVHLRGNPARQGMIQDVRTGPHGLDYVVFFGANDIHVHGAGDIVGQGAKDPVDALDRLRLGQVETAAEQLRRDLFTARLEGPLSDSLYSFKASRTEFYTYQFKPLLKYLGSPSGRLLIADEVGLGKTIEAGIVMLERQVRAGLDQLLVVCPAALRFKWRNEMRRRFDLDLRIHDGASFRELVDRLASNPEEPFRGVVSLALLRSRSILPLLQSQGDGLVFDMVVVDEAHHLRNSDTKSFGAGEWLSSHTEDMLFLTATPLHLGNEDLFHLLHLLDPAEFFDRVVFQWSLAPLASINKAYRLLGKGGDDVDREALARCLEELREQARRSDALSDRVAQELWARVQNPEPIRRDERVAMQGAVIGMSPIAHIFTRTKRREVVERFPKRKAHTHLVEMTPAQAEFYGHCSATLIDIFRRRHPDIPPQFVLTNPERIMASCMPAFGGYLRAWISNRELTLEDEDYEDEFDAQLIEDDVEDLRRLHADWEAIADESDAKLVLFLEVLDKLRGEGAAKAMVFSTFRRILDYLERGLRAHYGDEVELLRLDGSVPWEEREAICRRFEHVDRFAVLVTSEVAGEGLDFQYCSTMFNYDLPWNPMRVEQRVGRLDRMGQEADVVHIHNFRTEGTIDARIFFRLFSRIGIFERAVGDLESLLGNEVRNLSRAVFRRDLTRQEEEDLVESARMAIANKERQHREFEERRDELMGQEDFFTDEVSRMTKSGRFVGPEDVESFVRASLADHKGVRLRKDPEREGVWQVSFSAEKRRQAFVRQLRRELHAHGAKLSAAAVDLLGALAGSSRVQIAFDPKAVAEDGQTMLVTAAHPLVRGLRKLGTARIAAGVAGAALVEGGALGVGPGEHTLHLYELRISGLKSRIEWHAVCVDSQAEVAVPLDQGLWDFVHGEGVKSWPAGEPLPSCSNIAAAASLAESRISQMRDRRREELQARSGDLADKREASLRQYYGRKLAGLQTNLAKTTVEARRRMLEGKIRKTEARCDHELERLEAGRNVHVGHRLIGCVALRVEVTDSRGAAR